jgi:hypothetical protein
VEFVCKVLEIMIMGNIVKAVIVAELGDAWKSQLGFGSKSFTCIKSGSELAISFTKTCPLEHIAERL